MPEHAAGAAVRKAYAVSAGRLAWIVSALLLATGFAALGAWQLERARWKSDYLAAHAAALAAPPAGFAAAAGRAPPHRVAGEGRYDDAVTVLLDNRLRDGRAGIEVLTLFRPADGAAPLLVDRGWLPLPADRTVPPIAPAGAAPVEVSGLRVAAPSTGLAIGRLEFARGAPPPLWPRLDTARLGELLGEPVDARVVLLDDAAPHGFARAWPALPNTLPPERHRGYAVQWFALAATVLVVASLLLFRRRR
ncbi:MAG TPA: SURF1 family protein [Xanthomonadales bacterium]|nr:SURF1 family protein [Xanthomonadales bacterium]